MTNSKVVKAITLGTFILLITGFIVFKAGGLDTFFEAENGAVFPLVKSDSVIPTIPIDTQQPIVSDSPVSAPPSPNKAKSPEPMRDDSFRVQHMMSTSKSTIAIDQGELIWKLDSLLLSDSSYLKY